MLPVMAASGHFKYAQQSLPLHLEEMKTLPVDVPAVHDALMAGAFVGGQLAGITQYLLICYWNRHIIRCQGKEWFEWNYN